MPKLLQLILNSLSSLICLVAGAILVIELGFVVSVENRELFQQLHLFFMTYFLVDLGLRFLFSSKRRHLFATRIFDFLILLPLLGHKITAFSFFSEYVVIQVILVFVILGRLPHLNYILRFFRFNPAQIFLLGFVLAIIIGALLLSLPISQASGYHMSFIDALFSATSAICVTGLVTVDIGQYFSTFGQAVLLLLIQLGGLGIMTFYALITLFLKRRFSQQEAVEYQESFESEGSNELVTIIFSILKFTFLFELLGALLLFICWNADFSSTSQAVYYSVFHSISAFCNAGFSLFSTSLVGYAHHYGVILAMSFLILCGGIGFPVIFYLNRRLFIKSTFIKTKLLIKIPLIVTAILVVFGTLVIFFGEFHRAFLDLSLGHKVLMSFFHSVSSRTAGFHAMDLSGFHVSTLWFLIVLMFIGASPGSTGGGIKTTTFALLMLSVWATIRGASSVVLFGRTISVNSMLKAISIILISMLFVLTFFYFILLAEPLPFFELFFEAISAFGTVGFSLGATSQLSDAGKWLVICLMFIGRVGPLTLAFALARRRSTPNYTFPEERILLG